MNNNIKYHALIKLNAKNATPAPPVGTVLGPTGIDTHKFCEDFNKWSNNLEGLVNVGVIIYNDLSYRILSEKEYNEFRVNEFTQAASGMVHHWEDEISEKRR